MKTDKLKSINEKIAELSSRILKMHEKLEILIPHQKSVSSFLTKLSEECSENDQIYSETLERNDALVSEINHLEFKIKEFSFHKEDLIRQFEIAKLEYSEEPNAKNN